MFTCHVDSPKVVVETADKAGKYHLRLPRQPGGPGSQGLPDRRRVELGEGLRRFRQEDQEGREDRQLHPRRPEGGHRQDVALRPGRQRREAKKEADAAKAKFMDGTFVIFKGPLKDNRGQGGHPGRQGVRPGPTRRWKTWITWSRAWSS